MGPRAFNVCLALIGGLVLLSATPGIGAIIGLLFGFSIAFLVAPLTFAAQWALQATGVSVGLGAVAIGLLVLYGAVVLAGAVRAYRCFAAGDRDGARLIGAKVALFAALVPAGHLSSDVLARAWR